MKMTYTDRLVVFRRSKGLTRAEMAELIGISKSFYEKVECGDRTPSYNFICRFKQTFPDADIEYLFLNQVQTAQVNSIVVDLGNRLIKINGDKQSCSITPIEFGILSLLLDSKDKMITYDELLDRVWGIDYPGGSSETVQVAVSRLRKKLGIKDLIETVTGCGYRWKGRLDKDNTYICTKNEIKMQ
jgi:putative transcriptional regulator